MCISERDMFGICGMRCDGFLRFFGIMQLSVKLLYIVQEAINYDIGYGWVQKTFPVLKRQNAQKAIN
jgi:hypothetical protein